MKRILAAIDGSELGGKALQFAADLAGRLNVELLIIHVATNQPISEAEKAMIETEYGDAVKERLASVAVESPELAGLGQPILSALVREGKRAGAVRAVIAERLLEAAESSARSAGARNVHAILSHGDPARGILAAARDNQVDLIAVGSHGFGELRSVLLGSVSNKVAHLANCTVATVR
jgi:nucleotide-binding universal stress UspA family protein